MFHTIIIVGNVGKDAEMRYTPSGAVVMKSKVDAVKIGYIVTVILFLIAGVLSAVNLGNLSSMKNLEFEKEVKLACYELGFSEYDIVDWRAFCIWNGFVIEIKMEIEDDSF